MLTGLLVGALLVVAIGINQAQWRQPGDTFTWPTYENKELGIQFNYPAEWEVITSPKSVEAAPRFAVLMLGDKVIVRPRAHGDGDELAFQITIWDNPNNFKEKQYFNGEKGPNLALSSASTKTRILTSATGMITIYTTIFEPNSQDDAFVLGSGRIADITNTVQSVEYRQIFDQLLSTFRFVN